MKCKFCQAELEEGVSLCPVCGKEQEQETSAVEMQETAAPEIKEGIKATPGKIALAIAAGVVVLALLVAMVVSGIDGDLFKGAEETAASTEEIAATEGTVPPGTIPPDGNPDDVTCKGSYSVSDEELEASKDTVVAKVGNQELTLGQLQIYYWECIYAFDSEWGSYASMLGLDYSRGLDTQLCETGDVSMTWQQYFLDYALNTWHTHQAVALAGGDAGYVLTEEYQDAVDGLVTQIDEMVAYYGMKDSEEWIRDYIGPGCTVADYIDYMTTYYLGYGYLEHEQKNTTFTEDEVNAYFAEHETTYADSGVTKDSGKYYDVRHILIKVKNADGGTTYTEEDWAACKAAAQEILDGWKAGEATEDSFAILAKEKSEDGGSNYNGGLYEYLTEETNFVPNFKAWYLDESRQAGDTGLVQSDYGYHIMYFSGSQDIWYATAEADMISEVVSALMPAAMEKYPMTVDYAAIKLGQMDLVSG